MSDDGMAHFSVGYLEVPARLSPFLGRITFGIAALFFGPGRGLARRTWANLPC